MLVFTSNIGVKYVTKTFQWATLENWTATVTGNDTTGDLSSNALQSRTVGASNTGEVAWQWSGQFTDLGVPANASVVSIDSASVQTQVIAYTSGSFSSSSEVSLSPVGSSSIQLALGRLIAATDANSTTQTGTGATGLNLPSSTSVVMDWTDSLETLNNVSADVAILHDNLTFRIGYYDTQLNNPGAGSASVLGYAPSLALSDTVILVGAGSVATAGLQPSAQTLTMGVMPFGLLALSYNTQQNLGGGGPGGLLALCLNLETPAGFVRPGVGRVSVFGYSPSTGEPIVDVGTGDDLESGPASVSGAGDRILPNQVLTYPATGSVSVTGYAVTLTLADNLFVQPPAGSIATSGKAPVSGFAGSIEVGAGSLTTFGEDVASVDPFEQVIMLPLRRLGLQGRIPAVYEWRETASPGVGTAIVAGNAPTVIDGLNPPQASLSLTGYAPVATGAFTLVGTGVMASRRGSTQSEGLASRSGTGLLHAQAPKFTTVSVVAFGGSGVLESGPGSLQGPIYRGKGGLQSGQASMTAFGLVLPYEFPSGSRRAKGIEPKPRTRLKR